MVTCYCMIYCNANAYSECGESLLSYYLDCYSELLPEPYQVRAHVTSQLTLATE